MTITNPAHTDPRRSLGCMGTGPNENATDALIDDFDRINFIRSKSSIRASVAFSFGPVPMQPRDRLGSVCAGFVIVILSIAWHRTLWADESLDRAMSFHIAPSPLSTALLEFSSQSGLQVAAADADVAQWNTIGATGTYTPRVALNLILSGTGLKFSQIGATTLAIGKSPAPAPAASARID